MAKVRITNYVKTLQELSLIADKKQAQLAFVGYLKLLRQQRQLKNIKEIFTLWQLEQDRQNGVVRALVYTDQNKLMMDDKKMISQFLQVRFPDKKIILVEKNKAIGPGYMIEAEGSFFDFTYENQLGNFKKHLLEM